MLIDRQKRRGTLIIIAFFLIIFSSFFFIHLYRQSPPPSDLPTSDGSPDKCLGNTTSRETGFKPYKDSARPDIPYVKKSIGQRPSQTDAPQMDIRMVIEELLNSPDTEIRTEAVDLLEDLADEGGEIAIEFLYLALNDTDEDIRESALDTLIFLADDGNEIAAEFLISSLNNEHDDVRENTISTLAEIRHEGVVEALAGCLTYDENAEIRALAADALGEIGDASAISALEQALYDPDGNVQESAEEALEMLIEDEDEDEDLSSE